jgi:hypothetical protein
VNLHALEESLWLAAKVAWVCPEPHEQPHLHGLFFARATPEQQQRVRALLVHQKPRHTARLFCTLAATCQRKGASCNTLPCETRDLSYGGVALRLPDPLPRGTQVLVFTVFSRSLPTHRSFKNRRRRDPPALRSGTAFVSFGSARRATCR